MFESLNERLKNMTVVDIGLVKWSVFFGTIIIVKLFPQLLKVSFLTLAALMIVCSARPVYKFWIKR